MAIEVFRIGGGVRLWNDPGGGIVIHAVTPEGDPVELSPDQARLIADQLIAFADEEDNWTPGSPG